MEKELYQMPELNQLWANYATVSQDKCGLFLCRRGNADILLNNRSFHIEAGVLYLYTPYTFIRIVRHSDDIDGYLLEGDLEGLQPALSHIPVVDRISIRSHPCIRLTEMQCRRMEHSIENMNNHAALLRQAQKPKSVRLLRLLVQTLLHALCLEVLEIYFDSMPVEERQQNREERLFNLFLMSVYRHCARQRSVTFYADELHLSPNYLSPVLKAQSGRTAIQWIETVTMVQAQHLLGDSKLSIKEVTDRLSFPDQSTFGRHFKKHCGMSPSDYRKSFNK